MNDDSAKAYQLPKILKNFRLTASKFSTVADGLEKKLTDSLSSRKINKNESTTTTTEDLETKTNEASEIMDDLDGAMMEMKNYCETSRELLSNGSICIPVSGESSSSSSSKAKEKFVSVPRKSKIDATDGQHSSNFEISSSNIVDDAILSKDVAIVDDLVARTTKNKISISPEVTDDESDDDGGGGNRKKINVMLDGGESSSTTMKKIDQKDSSINGESKTKIGRPSKSMIVKIEKMPDVEILSESGGDDEDDGETEEVPKTNTEEKRQTRQTASTIKKTGSIDTEEDGDGSKSGKVDENPTKKKRGRPPKKRQENEDDVGIVAETTEQKSKANRKKENVDESGSNKKTKTKIVDIDEELEKCGRSAKARRRSSSDSGTIELLSDDDDGGEKSKPKKITSKKNGKRSEKPSDKAGPSKRGRGRPKKRKSSSEEPYEELSDMGEKLEAVDDGSKNSTEKQPKNNDDDEEEESRGTSKRKPKKRAIEDSDSDGESITAKKKHTKSESNDNSSDVSRTTTISSSGNGLKLIFKRTPSKEDTKKDSTAIAESGSSTSAKRALIKKSRKATILSSDEEDDGNGSEGVSDEAAKDDGSDDDVRLVLDSSSSEDDAGDESDGEKKKRKRGRPPKAKGDGGGSGNARKRVRVAKSSDSDGSEDENGEQHTPKGQHRKNIRKMLGKKGMTQSTLEAQAAERERKKRITQLQEQYNQVEPETEGASSGASQPRAFILDKDEESGETLVEVHPDLYRQLKPHQIDGVRFMYMSTIESVDKVDEPPGGCILAHCMGLGKTLQVICFLHTILTNKRLKFHTALVLAPVNVVLNWKYEVERWMGESLDLRVWEMTTMKNPKDRLITLENWQEEGGLMIMGYDSFRILATGKAFKKAEMRKRVEAALLDPGADIVVCDEGHVLKNEKTGISQVVNRIKSRRRICLTGTPLQNNLSEYHCMVQFVKPNLLGSKIEFKNRFENPIKNGQCIDSTPMDVRNMKQRAHILHSLLDGCVHRRDYVALTSALPPRQEYVIHVRLSDKQIELYRTYLDSVVGDLGLDSLRARKGLFADFQSLQRIWTHPYALYLHQLEVERKQYDNDLDDFIEDEDASTSEEEAKLSDQVDDKDKEESNSNEVAPVRRRTRQNPGEASTAKQEQRPDTPLEFRGWWKKIVSEEDFANVEISGKLVLLFELLKKCEEIGDKMLVFSQSLTTLAIIERFLEVINDDGGNDQRWETGQDYFRMDGSTNAQWRKKYIERFNAPKNLRARLFLISTRAGSLGTNLVGANRVIIFDANWNPSHDVQAIFRVYRYGQKKPAYIYRFIAQGTMEERIYDRQVTKQSLALRVVDEQQIERHFMAADLEELYKFDPVDLEAKKERPMLAPPKDLLLRDVMLDKSDWFVKYHEHDTLLQHVEHETLTEEEKETAWNEYKSEREGRRRFIAHSGNVPDVIPPGMQDPAAMVQHIYPHIRHWVDLGNRFIVESGENVTTRIEQILNTWLTEEPMLLTNPQLLLQKLMELVNQLETVTRKRADEQQNRLQAIPNTNPLASRNLYRPTPGSSGFPGYGQSSKEK